jgi:ribosome-binding factor A
MSHGRTQRIESEIQRELALLIARELKDPRVGNVTVTAVSVAPDMGSARVFFTPFAALHPPEQVLEGLTRAAGFLRGEIGRRLGLRHAPRLEFVFDESVEDAAHLSKLIDRAVSDDRSRR